VNVPNMYSVISSIEILKPKSGIWARLFKTLDTAIHWRNHLSSGQLLSTG